MPFSIHYGLSLLCLTMLLLPVAQGKVKKHRINHVFPTCCSTNSNATIRQPVNTCYIQEENTFRTCKVKAYIFVTENSLWCVDPRAWWIPQRLEKLAERGIHCKTLGNAFNSKDEDDGL